MNFYNYKDYHKEIDWNKFSEFNAKKKERKFKSIWDVRQFLHTEQGFGQYVTVG